RTALADRREAVECSSRERQFNTRRTRPMIRYFALLLLTALAAGCDARRKADSPNESAAPVAPRPDEPLRLAVVDDPVFGQALVRQWQAHSQDAVELIELTSEQVWAEPL